MTVYLAERATVVRVLQIWPLLEESFLQLFVTANRHSCTGKVQYREGLGWEARETAS